MLEGLSHVDAVLWIGERLADGLAHAHERGILHRDLKPANILLTDEGQPMLLDFNLSADVKGEMSRARVGGTLPYMAPEHLACFAGLPGPFTPEPIVDARSDVYALGVILHELLTGRPPFPRPAQYSANTLPDMINSRLGRPASLRLHNPSVTPAVESIVCHCLEPDPAQRYQSARQLLEDLQRHRNDLPLAHAREQSLPERSGKWLRRNRRGAIVTAAVLSVFIIVGLTTGLALRGKRLAQMESAATLSAFSDEADQAHLLLAARPRDVAQRREGLDIASRALERYQVLEASSWREKPIVRHLPPAERQRLVQAVGELLLVCAGAAEPTR
jgi:serine/threonine protein kinase